MIEHPTDEEHDYFVAQIPQYVLPGYELMLQEFAHVTAAELPANVTEEERFALKEHPAVVARRNEVIGRVPASLIVENFLWRIYHVYTIDHYVKEVTVIVEVYLLPAGEPSQEESEIT